MVWAQPTGGSCGGALRRASQNGTQGPCHVPGTPAPHCKAWRRTGEPGRMYRNKGCLLHHLRVT